MSHEANAAIVALGAKLELRCTVCESTDLNLQASPDQATIYCAGCDTIYLIKYARLDALKALHIARRKQL